MAVAGAQTAPIVPQYYRTDDPVQNLRLRVTLYRVSGGSGAKKKGGGDGEDGAGERKGARGDDSGSDDEGGAAGRRSKRGLGQSSSRKSLSSTATLEEMWSAEFGWQDKEFGPGEILKYVARVEEKKKSRGKHISKTRLEDDYVRTFEQMLRDNEPLFESMEEAKIFTYTDSDDFLPEGEVHKRVLTAEAEPSTLATGGAKAGLRGGTAKVGQMHLYRDAPFRTFYVMAAVDIETEAFRAHNPKTPMYEVPLVAIKAYKTGGVVEMRPGFSEEARGGAGGSAARMSPRKRGAKPLLRRYRFKSPRGGVYEYTVENATMDPLVRGPDATREDAALLEAEREAERRALELHAGKITTAFFGEPPAHASFRLHAFLEIVAAAKFDAETLFVEWEVLLPKTGWKLPHSVTDGKHGASLLHRSGAAAEAARHGMAGVTQTARAVWRQWRWRRTDVVEAAASSAAGGSGGPRPGSVGHGTPFPGSGGSPGALTNVKRTRGAMRGGSGRGGDPFPGFGAAEPDAREEPVAHLCFPIDFSLISHIDMHPHLAAEWPSVAFTVRSRDGWGREHVLGYGFHKLAPGAQCHDVTVPTWRPVGTVYQELQDFFLGGATGLREPAFAASASRKLGFETETSGELAVRVNTVLQRHAHDAKAAARYAANAKTAQARVSAVMARLDATASSTAELRATRTAGGAAGRPPLSASAVPAGAESFRLTAGGAMRRRRVGAVVRLGRGAAEGGAPDAQGTA